MDSCSASQGKYGIWIVHYSIQSNHVHLLAEVDGDVLQPSLGGVPVTELHLPGRLGMLALWKGSKSLFGMAAKRLNNRLWRRKGQVFAGRPFAESLATPRQTHNALGYVLNNGFHHEATDLAIDPYSSGKYFDGWEAPIPPPDEPPELRPVVAPRTWLLSEGWKRYGPIRFPVRE